MKAGKVFYQGIEAGIISEVEEDELYRFSYLPSYLAREDAQPVSLTFPLREEPYEKEILFPFFDGLIPEGWLLNIAISSWKINHLDRMELLLTCCRDCIGAVHVERIEEEEHV